MKRFTTLLIIPLILVSCAQNRKVSSLPEDERSFPVIVYDGELYAPHTLIIMYDEAVGKEPLKKAFEEYGAEIIYEYGIIDGFAIRIPEDKAIEDAMAFFRKVEGVTSVERDRIIHLTDPVRPPLLTM